MSNDDIKNSFKIITNGIYGQIKENDLTKSLNFLVPKLGITFLSYEFIEKIKEKYDIGYNDLYNFGLVQSKVRDYEINKILYKI
jgi:hypothetical protein